MQLSSGSQIPDGLLAAMTLRNENSRLGVPSKNPALHQGIDAPKMQNAMEFQSFVSTTRIGSRCTGKESDAESGLDYFGARYYGSSMGRMMSPDPSGLAFSDLTNPQSFNLYSYVLNNPLINTDPTGMECVWDDGSYDAADDPDTGNAAGCNGQGGTYIDPANFENSLLTNGQMSNVQYGDSSSTANQTLVDSWVTPSSTTTADPNNVPLSGDFSFNMTSDQFIGMMQQSGFQVSALDTALGKTHLGHPGTNMRDSHSWCSVHLNINPGTGVNGVPVSGEFHYDEFNPLKSSSLTGSPDGGGYIPNMPLHAMRDVIPDLLDKTGAMTWTGNQNCTHP